MTAALVTRASLLRTRLEALDQSASNVAEVNALEGLRAGLAPRAEKLRIELNRQRLLETADVEIAVPASLVAARKRAGTLLEKFRAETKAATLKRGQFWNALLDEVDAAWRDLAAAVLSGWKAHRQEVFAGETPSQIRGKLARTPENDAAYQRYDGLYARLKSGFDGLPADTSAIASIRKIADELETTAKGFNFDVPPDVKEFLEAVLSVRGASLSLLTPPVLAWLEDNGGLDSYAVRATGRS